MGNELLIFAMVFCADIRKHKVLVEYYDKTLQQYKMKHTKEEVGMIQVAPFGLIEFCSLLLVVFIIIFKRTIFG